ncbi:lysine-specific demethylase 8-like [Anneissia japonica]|uniref:lysine-specific demethylase 8-like n=1 Tax=Anneissia japonica TaxID=1529436 RepID=UPI00142556B4|nr:lysine-specific demethylase 8-like [Anneissia japonica]XP_033112889.1 lysine-specific demethylase 8-like [Anneissia japonica]
MYPLSVSVKKYSLRWEFLVVIAIVYASGERLGERGPQLTVYEVSDWPKASDFFNNFALVSKPVVVRGGGKISPAFKLWTDEYLLRHADSETIVTVEGEKKENRESERTEGLTFLEFLTRYKNEEMYMVESVPESIRKDVVLPAPLQCHVMKDSFSSAMMWFSNGGTSSVLHIDSVDNINCVMAGRKHVVLIDRKYADKIPLKHPGNYCGVDVDDVDFDKYPGLLSVEYHHVDLQPGDCLYIPYRWFHQVRSQDRNIAVNIWWNHYMMKNQDFSQCQDIPPGELKTIDKFEFNGVTNMFRESESIRDHMLSITQNTNQPMTYQDFKSSVIQAPPDESTNELFNEVAAEVFLHLDDNYDKTIDTEEISALEESVWREISDILDKFSVKLQTYEEELQRQGLDGKDEL